MNQGEGKSLFITILLYAAIVLLVAGYSYIRHIVPQAASPEILFGFLGYAGYFLAAWYLLMQMRNNTAGVQQLLPFMGTMGTSISAAYTVTLLAKFPFLSGPVLGQYPLVMGAVSILMFFAMAGLFALIIWLGDRLIQKKFSQPVPTVRSWEACGILWISTPLVVLNLLDSWKVWYSLLLAPAGQRSNLLMYLPPAGMVICIWMAVVLLLFFWHSVRDIVGGYRN
jgi:hypothetical protein